MSKITYELSDKTRDGMSQIVVRICISRTKRYRLQSHIYVPRKRFVDGKVVIPRDYLKDYKDTVKAYNQFKILSGQLEMLISSSLKDMLTRDSIIALLDASDIDNQTDIFSSTQLLDNAIQKTVEINNEPTIYTFMDRYGIAKELSANRKNPTDSLKRLIARFEKFREIFKLNLSGLTYPSKTCREDIVAFKGFVMEEEKLARKYPRIHKQCVDYALSLFPFSTPGRRYNVQHRTINYLPNLMKNLRAVYNWIYDNSLAPIDRNLSTECRTYKRIYTDAFYLTKEERNTIDRLDLSRTPVLERQRDIFIFNCLTGCRYSDLVTLTEENIVNGILQYRPLKTRKQTNPVIPQIPLLPRALELIEKYRGADKNNRLFPFSSLSAYNDSIKSILRLAGITRYVYGSADPSSDLYHNPLCEVATSYTARKTFIGCAYKATKSPEIIGTMSGHAPGSTSFCRYRTIDDEDRKEVIDLLDG